MCDDAAKRRVPVARATNDNMTRERQLDSFSRANESLHFCSTTEREGCEAAFVGDIGA